MSNWGRGRRLEQKINTVAIRMIQTTNLSLIRFQRCPRIARFDHMRISRTQQLHPFSASTHMYWKCHNHEYYLQKNSIKDLYIKCINESLNRKSSYHSKITISSFCVMSNHFHQIASYRNSSIHLSNHMRYSQGLFGARYNRMNSRAGKVSIGRPKTPLIQNSTHEMKVHLYIEANPIRAGICKIQDLKYFKHCSFRFYAFGIEDQITKILTIPQWYLDLGRTSLERQKKYRELFLAALKSYAFSPAKYLRFQLPFIGSQKWIKSQHCRLAKIKKLNSLNDS